MDFSQPMLAARVKDLFGLRYPLLGSAKLDGIRAIVRKGVVLSRKLKPIPNQRVQEIFNTLEGFDGELILGDPTAPLCFNTTNSFVMSQQKATTLRLQYFVFDYTWDRDKPYIKRFDPDAVMEAAGMLPGVRLVHQQLLQGPRDVLMFQERLIKKGFEGVILRDPHGLYKCGRSTLGQQYLLKLKQFEDVEGK